MSKSILLLTEIRFVNYEDIIRVFALAALLIPPFKCMAAPLYIGVENGEN